jgi:peptidase M50-like protein
MSPWAALAWLWLLSTVINLVSGLVMAFVSWGVGARPVDVRFHQGPSLWAFRFQGIRWSFGPLTIGSSVSFNPSDSRETEDAEENAFTRLSLPRRLIVSAVGCYGMLLLALVCLPLSRGLTELSSGFEQVVNVFSARQRVVAFFTLLGTEGFWTALGVLSAKLAALNLLPLPPLPGFMPLREVWVSLGKSRKWGERFTSWSVTMMLLLWGGWAFGLYGGLSSLSAHARAAGDVQRGTLTRDGER